MTSSRSKRTSSRQHGFAAPLRRRATVRPQLEALEDRLVPTSLGWEVSPNFSQPEGASIALTGSYSNPSGSESDTYTVDIEWGDGTTTSFAASGTSFPIVSEHRYDDDVTAGTLLVRVTDVHGEWVSSSSPSVYIYNIAPTATFGNGGAVDEGGTNTGLVGFTNPLDPSNADTAAGFHYAYDFNNDGTFDVGNGTYAGSGSSATTIVPATFFADGPGTRRVKGRIIDKNGGFTDYTTDITINNVAPTATFGNGGAVSEGTAGAVSFSNQLDPSGADTTAGFKYSYDFDNNGTFEIIDSASATATVPASFLADGGGSRTVKGRIKDVDGGFTDYTTTITINNVAPTATFGNGGAVNEGSAGVVSFSDQTDVAADLTGLRYSYDFNNDGTFEITDSTSASVQVPATYLDNGDGSRRVKGRIKDKDGGFTDYTTDITINNVKPTATFGNGGAVSEGTAGSVSFSNQADPSGADTTAGFKYSYDFDNNGTFEIIDSTSATATVPASFLADGGGSRTVKGRIKDMDGGFTDYTTTITINNVPPTATLGNSGPVSEGSTALVSFTNQTDVAADLAGLRYSYDFDNDDTFEITDSASASAEVAATYLADGDGERTVRARIKDKDGGFTDYTTTVSYGNVAPTAAFSNGGAVDEGSSGTVSFIEQHDASEADTAAGFTYSYDFDSDGTFEIVDSTAASADVPAAFLADGPGNRTVTGRIKDKDGGFTDYTTSITINNVAPVFESLPDELIVTIGDDAVINGTFADPGADSWTIYIDWDDGTPLEGAPSEGRSFARSHHYASEGSYQVTVAVFDDDDGFHARSFYIHVMPANPLSVSTATLNQDGQAFASIPNVIEAILTARGVRSRALLLVAELPNSVVFGSSSLAAQLLGFGNNVQFLRSFDVRAVNATLLDQVVVTFQVDSPGEIPPLLEFEDPRTGLRIPIRGSRLVPNSFTVEHTPGSRIWRYRLVLDATSFPSITLLYGTVFTFSAPAQLQTVPNLNNLYAQTTAPAFASAGGALSSLATPGFASGLQLQRAVGSSQVLSLDPARVSGGEGDEQQPPFSITMALELIQGVHQATWSSAASEPPPAEVRTMPPGQVEQEQQEPRQEPPPEETLELLREQLEQAEQALRGAQREWFAQPGQQQPSGEVLQSLEPLTLLLGALEAGQAEPNASKASLAHILLLWLLLLSPQRLTEVAAQFGLSVDGTRRRRPSRSGRGKTGKARTQVS